MVQVRKSSKKPLQKEEPTMRRWYKYRYDDDATHGWHLWRDKPPLKEAVSTPTQPKKLKASYLLFEECEFTVLCVSFHEEPRYQVPGTVLYQVKSGCWILCGIRRVNNFWRLPQNVWPNFPQSRKHLTSQSTSFESSIFKFSISSFFLSSQQILQ